MLIQYKTTKSRRHVSDRIGQALIDRGIAQLYQTREVRAEPVAVSAVVVDESLQNRAIFNGADPAPYGYKKDGTPKKPPGRMVIK